MKKIHMKIKSIKDFIIPILVISFLLIGCYYNQAINYQSYALYHMTQYTNQSIREINNLSRDLTSTNYNDLQDMVEVYNTMLILMESTRAAYEFKKFTPNKAASIVELMHERQLCIAAKYLPHARNLAYNKGSEHDKLVMLQFGEDLRSFGFPVNEITYQKSTVINKVNGFEHWESFNNVLNNIEVN